ncbi:MAG TPA: hypothetical protein VHB97_05935 [Polyangia bacterium]|jgi:hypothetical protein|nr:hypothetical protein [Polyangia bacterium]
MPAHLDGNERTRLQELAAQLRAATWDALQNRSTLARSLDESRGELERLLMLSAIDAAERRRVVVRAQMMLDAWRGMAVSMVARAP